MKKPVRAPICHDFSPVLPHSPAGRPPSETRPHVSKHRSRETRHQAHTGATHRGLRGERGHGQRVPQTAPGPSKRTAPALCNEFWRRPTLPRVPPVVPSALEGLTAGFGMDPGVSPPLWPPETCPAIHRSRGDHKRKMRLRPRHISTGQLNDSRRLHPRPINPVVSRMPYLASQWGISSRGRLPA